MTRLASMIIPLAAAAFLSGAAQAGEYYERTGSGHYKPADGAWYSSTCCYKKIIKHITIAKAVWVKVPPPKAKPKPVAHHHHPVADDDDDVAVEAPRPRPAQAATRPQVVELGEVVRRGDRCRKPVQVRDGNTTIIVMVNVRCR
jgi:hypothetical protein